MAESVIALITTSLGWGGTEGHVADLAIGFVRRGIQPIVIVDHPPLDRIHILNRLGVKVEVLTNNPNITKSDYDKSLSSILKRLNPNLIHLNCWERRESILKVAKKAGIPVIETLHTTVMPTLNIKTSIRYFFSICGKWWAYKKALPAVINISDISLENFRKAYPFIKKTIRIYCGTYFPEERNDVGANGTAVKVLWIGSMIERKRPIWALKLWKRIAVDFPFAQLIMIGDGHEMGLIKALVKDMPPESVILCGNIPDLHSMLKTGHIMFHTSTAEGIPKNILYALNFGMPVVATNVGAISEAVVDGENGFLTEVIDDKLMENRLRQLILNPLLRENMGIQGRQRGGELFRLDNMIDNILRAYKDFYGVNVISKESIVDQYFQYPLG